MHWHCFQVSVSKYLPLIFNRRTPYINVYSLHTLAYYHHRLLRIRGYFYNEMRYINLCFTYLLTYARWQHIKNIKLHKITKYTCVYKTQNITRCHAIAKTTARCAQYMSALKIVCKHKSSRRLRKNLHITILSLFGGEIIFEVFQQM